MAVATKAAPKGAVVGKAAPAQKTAVKEEAVALAENGRKIIYPDIRVNGILIPLDKLILTVENAKEKQGWEAESTFIERETRGMSPEVAKTANVEFGDNYDFKDYYGEKIKLHANTHNRPMDENWVKEIARQILSGIWQFNGEALITGETGLALSRQHRDLGLILAEQMRSYEGDDDQKTADAARYQEQWPEPLSILAIEVTGIKEDSLTTRTLDNVKPRTLKDVLFADTELFKDYTKDQRAEVCRYAEYGIRTVRDRTGDDKDAFAPGRAQSDHLDFFTRHPRLAKAVKFVVTEMNKKDTEGKKPNAKSLRDLSIGTGTAAGLMFLMGSAGSDQKRWVTADNPSDRFLTFDSDDGAGNVVKDGMWSRAQEFWQKFMDPKDKTFDLAKKEIKGMDNPNTAQKGPVKAKLAVVVNVWNQWFDGGRMTPTNLAPEYEEVTVGDNVVQKLVVPSCGGIDLGDAKRYYGDIDKKEKAEEAERKAQEDGGDEGEVDEEVTAAELAEVEAQKEAVKQASLAKKVGEPAKAAPVQKKPGGLRGGTAGK